MRDLVQFGLSGVVSPETMRVVDKNADEYGVSAAQRMESAGCVLASAVRSEDPESVLILCGTGNNGGDGFVCARHLAKEYSVKVIFTGDAKTPEARAAFSALEGCPAELASSWSAEDFSADVIVDALLGTGASLPLREPYASLVDMMNMAKGRVLACDMPTPGVRADRVIAFHLAKTEGAEVYSIGIPFAAEVFCGKGDRLPVPEKPSGAHKGWAGYVLVIGGGPYQGAPFLAGCAALRSGADVVRVATPVDGFMPDLILERLPGNKVGKEHLDRLLVLVKNADVVIAGPGLGADPESLEVASQIVSAAKRAVVDADLLRNPLPRAREQTIYTPHAGEFARIFCPVPEKLSDRGVVVREAAKRAGGTVILKGAIDVISDGSRVKFNRSGAPGMTTGGTGDVLSGVCGGLLARMDAFPAACAAVYAAGKAGELADEDTGDGLIASDLLRHLAYIVYKEK
ncbi:MAG: NAD(P)H-hydrate dehydratase [Methanocorpusculum sp.]|uniref:NAD(P)H-hydrate dehydratase n=1 Tax=Methanocorpusculum sp. TaxID=2058474 RepID=UPI0027235CB9|nr:NAD(P)H-hydrate dehydratase [Methanocorpusculum sp.]MDO9523439.1 NAD(P)H-hydrate dehydratase [Methanocorpusculum sp.]